MSEIKTGGPDQYGKVQSLNGIAGEGVKTPDEHSLATGLQLLALILQLRSGRAVLCTTIKQR